MYKRQVYDGAGNPAPNKVACKKPFTVTDVDKSYQCVSLVANPANGTTVPFSTTLTATAQTQNTTIKEYQFNFGDGSNPVSYTHLDVYKRQTYSKGTV